MYADWSPMVELSFVAVDELGLTVVVALLTSSCWLVIAGRWLLLVMMVRFRHRFY